MDGRDKPVAVELAFDRAESNVRLVFRADENRDDYLVIAIDATKGRALLRSTYHGSRDEDRSIAMAVSADGSRVYVTGYNERIGGHACPEFATIGLDAVDGRHLWTHLAETKATEVAVGGTVPCISPATPKPSF